MVSSINGKYVQQQEAHYEKLLPQNIEAECSLLGSLLIEPELFSSIKPLLQPDDFYRDSHQTIFEAMLALSLRGVPADFMTLCDELERRHQLEQVGGAAYITSLVNYVPTSGYAMHYAGIVVRTSLQRRLIGAAGKIAAMSYEGEAEEALSQAQKMLNDI